MINQHKLGLGLSSELDDCVRNNSELEEVDGQAAAKEDYKNSTK